MWWQFVRNGNISFSNKKLEIKIMTLELTNGTVRRVEASSPVAGAVSVSRCLSTSCSAWRLHRSDAVRRGSYLGRTKLGAGGGRPWYQPSPAEGKGSKYFPTLEQWAGGWPRGWRTGVAGRRCAPDLHSLRHPLFVYLYSLVHHLTPNCPGPFPFPFNIHCLSKRFTATSCQ